MTVKNVINNLYGKNTIDIVSELLLMSYYNNNVIKFYKFFGLQGGTIWILATYILRYKLTGNKTTI